MDPTQSDARVPPPAVLSFKSPKSVSIAVPSAAYSNQFDAERDGEGDETDAVAWPTNRCCYEELTPHELAAVEQLFAAREDAPSFMKWVVVHRPPQTFAPRLLVLSPFRAWLVKRRQAPFRSSLVVSRELQLLHLVDLRVLRLATYQPSDPTMLAVSIKMRFRTAPVAHERRDDDGQGPVLDEAPGHGSGDHNLEELHFDPGVHGETIVRLCQRSLHALRLAFPGQRLPRLALPRQCNWQEFFTLRDAHRRDSAHQTPPTQADRKAYGDAMAMAYRAFCDDLGVPVRASVAARLRECLDVACVDVPYCLRAVPSSATQPVIPTRHHAAWRGAGLLASLARLLGLETFSTAAMQRLEVLALARTLANCHDGFEDVIVYDVTLTTEALRSLFQALRAEAGSAGTGVRGLSLTNVGLTTAALRVLQHVVLQSTIRQGGASSTAASGLALRRLDLSFNAFSALMAHALAMTLELVPGGLEVLQLEQCRLSMLASARVLGAMRTSHGFSSALRELNLSGNTLGVDGTRALALWITGAFALHALDLSRTRLQTDAFFRAFQQNSILHESSLRALDLSYNRLGTFASRALGDILGKTQSLATLVLRGMKQSLLHPRRLLGDLSGGRRHRVTPTRGLTTAQLTSVLAPMLQNRARAAPCRVDLSENDLRGAKAAALARLVDSAPAGALASLRVDHAALTDKHAVLLLHALRGSRALASLSLEGNGFTRRTTKRSYRRFHRETAVKATTAPATDTMAVNAIQTKALPANERAAADALALLLGGKTSATASDGDDSLAPLYLPHHAHHAKRVPLRELSLRAPGGSGLVFGERILTGVADALATNATLQLLDVSGNECGDALARALGRALPQNATLRALYWDDNFTTVEGFGAFYDGLLRNQTLSVVQLPINDTRRILEEQKDPPRERLFSVLGKIFKVTERNQTLRDRRRRSHKSPTSRTSPHGDDSVAPSGSPRHRRRARGDNQAADASEAKTAANKTKTRREPADDAKPERDDDEESKAVAPVAPTQVALTVAASTRVAEDKDEEQEASEASWAARYATRPARYPTTIQSWSRDGLAGAAAASSGGEDRSVRTSWDQIGSLAAMLT